MIKSLRIGYVNHRGEFAIRTIVPRAVWFGSTEWHPEAQWLMTAMDVEKNEYRDFAIKDMICEEFAEGEKFLKNLGVELAEMTAEAEQTGAVSYDQATRIFDLEEEVKAKTFERDRMVHYLKKIVSILSLKPGEQTVPYPSICVAREKAGIALETYHASEGNSYAKTVEPYAAAIRMIRDAVGELFGPVASIESEEATLLRGPEPCHDAEAIIDALKRVAAKHTYPFVHGWKFPFGTPLRKIKGSSWRGKVVGFYRTSLTRFGYVIESASEPGSCQLYPEAALELWEPQDSEDKLLVYYCPVCRTTGANWRNCQYAGCPDGRG